jgi:small subunit ribosomal protein S1
LGDDTPLGDESFAALFGESERANVGVRHRPAPVPGDRVRGKILSIGRETLFVELADQQGEGMLDLVELRDASGQITVVVGDPIEAVVAERGRKGGMLLLRRTVGRGSAGRMELLQAFQQRLQVEGTITGVNKGGVEVNVAGVRAFCPISQLDLRHVEDASLFLGQKLMFRIARYEDDDRRGPNIVLSRRAVLEEEARARAVETRAKLRVGAVMPGVVTALKEYGAFIDLGGIEGMLHVSEIGFQRVARPADILSIGQHVSVQVIRMDQTSGPGRSEQIALSLKALEPDPWETAVVRFPEGSRVRGVVTRIAPFGVFVELAPGVEGLAHISELSDRSSVRPTPDAPKPGDSLDVSVISVDRARRRLSLSLASPDEALDSEARAAVERAAAPAKLGTFADLFKNDAPIGKP